MQIYKTRPVRVFVCVYVCMCILCTHMELCSFLSKEELAFQISKLIKNKVIF